MHSIITRFFVVRNFVHEMCRRGSLRAETCSNRNAVAVQIFRSRPWLTDTPRHSSLSKWGSPNRGDREPPGSAEVPAGPHGQPVSDGRLGLNCFSKRSARPLRFDSTDFQLKPAILDPFRPQEDVFRLFLRHCNSCKSDQTYCFRARSTVSRSRSLILGSDAFSEAS